mgnify:CR=1 FL=1
MAPGMASPTSRVCSSGQDTSFSRLRRLNLNQTDYTTDLPGADLELTVPNDRSAIDVCEPRENVFIGGHSTDWHGITEQR